MLHAQKEMDSECLLTAAQYRRLWLDSACELGLVAETLADALGWQPTGDQILPDVLELAQRAVARISTLEQSLALYQPRLTARMAAPSSLPVSRATAAEEFA